MDELKGKVLNLKDEIAYASGAVISKTLLKKESGSILRRSMRWCKLSRAKAHSSSTAK